MNDLDKLKNILFGQEKRALDAITRRLDTPESRAADVADILPDAVSRSYEHDQRLAKALQEPLEVSMRDSIRRDPQSFADALFPVMGPAIRKSISEALKSLVQSMNRAVDTSLSPTARFKAWRAGVPLGEWVLSQSLVYRVDEAYLIRSDNGLLISHVQHSDVADKDEDAVSAMLTAIQDFVRESFSQGQAGNLDSAVIGVNTVWISHGPHAMLACVIRGVPPNDLREEMTATIERIHLNHDKALASFHGDTEPNPGIDQEMENCLRLQAKDEAGAGRAGLPVGVTIILALLAGVFIYWLVNGYLKDQRMAEFGSALNQTPGIVTTQLQRSGGILVARGLRDPLAPDPVAIAAQLEIPADELDSDFRPFQSLEPKLVIARARTTLAPPEGVKLEFDDGILVLSGVASQAWRNQAATLAPAIGGIAAVDTNGLKADDRELLARIRKAVVIPPGVELSVRDGVITANGRAPHKWITALPGKLDTVADLAGRTLGGLHPVELDQIRQLARAMDGQEVFFASGDQLQGGQQAKLTLLASQMRRFASGAITLGLTPEFSLSGYTDGTGDRQLNLEVQIQRAERVKLALALLGVDPGWILVRGAALAQGDGEANQSLRKVRIGVRTNAPDGGSLITP